MILGDTVIITVSPFFILKGEGKMAKLPSNISSVTSKQLPNVTTTIGDIPQQTPLSSEQVEQVPKLNILPAQSEPNQTTPEQTAEKTEKPSEVKEENCVTFNGKKVEIKPTKLKYFRNKAASGYNAIKALPIQELLTYPKGELDETRDADQLVYDFLIAAFDDPVFVRDNYDEFDAEFLNKVVDIFGRINGIEEKKETLRKNKEAQMKH